MNATHQTATDDDDDDHASSSTGYSGCEWCARAATGTFVDARVEIAASVVDVARINPYKQMSLREEKA